MTERPIWHLRLLGSPALTGEPDPVPLDRKLSAVLAYLALEGPTSRARMAALLWPSSSPAGALNNLAQAVRRVRLSPAAQLIRGREVLALDTGMHVDAPQLRAWYRAGEFGAFLAAYEPLLAPFDFDDCPEFEDWLLAERDTWREWQITALDTLAQAAEQAGDVPRALEHAQRLLLADPTEERHYARVMGFQAALGQRARALETWEACQLTLQRAFGVTPAPDTAALARRIMDGRAALAPAAASPGIPVSVLRPPVLIGREQEWAQMEDAWQKNQGVCLIGEPGVGKSRLVQEFALAHGGRFYFECRPGDEHVPFGLTIRMLRKVLQEYPDLSFEPWVGEQLARILPEFGPPPPPLASQADKVRFYQAMTEVLRGAVEAGLTVIAYDDTHHFDDSSAEAQLFMWGALGWGDPDAPFRIVFNSRPQEYSSLAAESLADLVHTGRVHVIELRPLPQDAARQLVTSLRVPRLEEVAGDLYRYTGGNPQYLLETVKHLIETGQTRPDAHLPFSPPVSSASVLARRLKQLSPAALHAAQAAATLQSDFTLDLVARTLRLPLLEVLPAWQELERAQMITEGRFSHDLVYEAAQASMGEAERAALHRSAARVLEQQGAQPARVAPHWQSGGELRRAAEQFRAASALARSSMRLQEAAAFMEQADALDGPQPRLQ